MEVNFTQTLGTLSSITINHLVFKEQIAAERKNRAARLNSKAKVFLEKPQLGALGNTYYRLNYVRFSLDLG